MNPAELGREINSFKGKYSVLAERNDQQLIMTARIRAVSSRLSLEV